MRAHAAVQRVSRDATVVNQMRVVVPGAARREDGDIRRAALAALEWHALLPDEVIRVHVCRGRVRLCGRVEDEGARMDAEEAVRQLANVAGVINELEVAAKATSEPTRERRHARQGAERRT
jgi:osmotically-inducible protein OsmY